MKTQSPEYLRVREEIAKKLYQLHRGIINTQTAHKLFNKEEEHLDFYYLLADSILAIKGLAILADDQSYPDCTFYCPECKKFQINHRLNLYDDNWRKVVE